MYEVILGVSVLSLEGGSAKVRATSKHQSHKFKVLGQDKIKSKLHFLRRKVILIPLMQERRFSLSQRCKKEKK